MRELPISIQRAILRRNALSILFGVPMLVGIADYLPWSSMLVLLSFLAMCYVLALSKTAKRLKALQKDKQMSAPFAKLVENFMDNILLMSLPFLAVGLLAIHWSAGLSGNVVHFVLFPSVIALCMLSALCFYLAQLPAVFPDLFPRKKPN